ncbi:MAG: hypothetical protein Kow0099_00620 [Candidatus Abyssubacteria bacterium]
MRNARHIPLEITLAGLILVILTILIYHRCLTKYFAMEDFLCIAWVQEEGAPGVLRSFYSDNEYGVYRPLSIHVYYYLCRLLFGLEPFGYHLVSLGSQVLNVLLVATVGLLLIQRPWAAFLAGAIYLSRISHYIGVFWAAGINEVWLALFYLLSLTSFVLYGKRGNPAYYGFALVGFALALTSKESAVTLPFVLLAYGLVCEGASSLKEIATKYGPFFGVLAAYLVLKLVIWKPMVGETYEIGVGMWVFRNLLAYLLFQINITHLLMIAFNLFAKINLYSFLRSETIVDSLIGGGLVVAVIGLYYRRAGLLSKIRAVDMNGRLLIFSLIFFVISLAPALLMKNRVQQYYLFVPSIAFSLAAAVLLEGRLKTLSAKGAVIGLLLATVLLGYSWMERIPDGRTTTSARDFLENMNAIIEQNPDIQGIHVEGGTTFIYQVLWSGDAFKSFLRRPVPVTFDFQRDPPNGKGILRVRLQDGTLSERGGL